MRKTNVERIVDKMRSAGVRFPLGAPDRAHNHCHGELRDTFLVFRQGYQRRGSLVSRSELLNAAVPWEYAGSKGLGIVLSGTAKSLAQALALEFDFTDEHGEGGLGLVVHDKANRDLYRQREAEREAEWLASE